MWTAEWVERCPVCEDRTPHSRKRVDVRRIVGLAALVAFAGSALVLSLLLAVVPGLLVFGWSLASDGSRLWRTRCERCRTREWARLERGRPKLDGTTEINIL